MSWSRPRHLGADLSDHVGWHTLETCGHRLDSVEEPPWLAYDLLGFGLGNRILVYAYAHIE